MGPQAAKEILKHWSKYTYALDEHKTTQPLISKMGILDLCFICHFHPFALDGGSSGFLSEGYKF